jgi:hypothetical protein
MEYRIIRNLAILGKNRMWIKELNIVRWYDKHDRFDIREWTPDHVYFNRGITLSDEEMYNLKEAINGYYFSDVND